MKRLTILFLLTLFCTLSLYAKVKVVTTLPVYATIAQTIGGGLVGASSIGLPSQDPHHVLPKPSFVLKVRRADLFITTGLDLELWVPVLLDKAGNKDLLEGGVGYVSASDGMTIMEKPTTFSKAEGAIHVFGNPHVYVSPFNIIIAARNITEGLKRVDRKNADAYEKGYKAYRHHLLVKIFGEDLLKAMPEDQLIELARGGDLYDALEKEGKMDLLSGWMKKAYPLRGKRIITYHKAWVYFTTPFNIKVVQHVEPKVGIPPSLKHIHQLIQIIKRDNIKVILAASYYDIEKVKRVAKATGCHGLIVPTQPDKHHPNFESLMDEWLDDLVMAFREK